MSRFAFIIVLLAALAASSAAFAHASLVRAEPADGAMLGESPKVMTLTFNEPVSPLVMRLVGPDGEVIAPPATARDRVVTVMPPRLREGTHVLSWRVVSADGHPVSGSFLFSVGAASAPAAGAQSAGDTLVQSALWAARLAVYAALFLGVGGVFFGIWIDSTIRARGFLVALLTAGLAATLLSLGLQGLDALDLPISQLARTPAPVYNAGLATAYGATAIAAECALVAGLFAMAAESARRARVLALSALLGAALALALSGHAGSVEPRWLTRTVVFLHAVCVAFWIGALIPLVLAIRAGEASALARFSRLIPLPLAVLVASGGVLGIVQLDRVDALWTTRYGLVLAAKLALIAVVLALAAANRYALVPRFQATGAGALRPLAASIRSELALALVILALVALWRLTPPPRALAAVQQVSFHVHGERAMAQVDIEPVRGRGGRMGVLLLDARARPLAAKELTLVLANPAAGIEPMRRTGVRQGDPGGANWRVDDLRIPVDGRWRLRLEILISDFEKIVLEDAAELRRMP